MSREAAASRPRSWILFSHALPDRLRLVLLDRLSMARPLWWSSCAAVAAASLATLLRLPRPLSLSGLRLLWLLALWELTIAAVHELGHVAALRARGGVSPAVGIAFSWELGPHLFTDIRGLRKMPSAARVAVLLAGYDLNLLGLTTLGILAIARRSTGPLGDTLLALHATSTLLFVLGLWPLSPRTDLGQVSAEWRRTERRQRARLALAGWVLALTVAGFWGCSLWRHCHLSWGGP